MSGRGMHRFLGLLGVFVGVVAFGGMLATAAYGASSPVDSGRVQPSTGGNAGTPTGPGSNGVVRPGVSGTGSTPGIPISEEQYQAAKERAASGEAGTNAQVDPGRSIVRQPTLTTTFGGAAMQSHFGLGLPYCCARIGTPDTIVAKSFNRVLEGVNESLRLFDNAGNVIQHTSLNQFFCSDDRPCREYIFDPKVYFDANGPNPRFYAVALEALGRDDTNPNNDFSRIWLAVSRSPDPTALSSVQWCRYAVDGKFQRSTEPVSWADYPGLGAGTDTILVSNNQYGFTPPPAGSSGFTYALVRAFNKAVATNNASSCPSIPFTTFRPSDTLNDGAAFTLQPVQHYTNPSSFTGTTNPAYLVNTASFEGSSYRLYRVRNYASSPSMTTVANSALFSGTFTYGVPPSAPGGSGAMIDTGDTRVQQAAGVGDAIFLSHGTSCDFGGGSGEACIRLVRLIAGQSGTGDVTATLSQQITFGAQDAFYWMPGVAVNNAQDIAVPFQYSTATQPLSVRWTEKPLSSTLFAASQVLRNGFCQLETGYQGPPRNHYRSGDYTGAQRDPSDGTSFWLAGERATSFGTTFPDDTTSPTCQWETFIGKIVP